MNGRIGRSWIPHAKLGSIGVRTLDLKSFRPRAAQLLLYLGLGDLSRLEHVVAAIDTVRLPGDEFRRVAGEKEN
jgi:hypothetical protein